MLASVVISGCGEGSSSAASTPIASGSTQPFQLSSPLAGAAFPVDVANYAPGSSPSVRNCVDTWNEKAPLQTRRWIATNASDRAAVEVLQVATQPIGTTQATPARRWACSFRFAVGSTKVAWATSPPQPATGSAWEGEILTYAASERDAIARDFTLKLRNDGTISTS